MTPKHGLLLFITSCLSGCGQMYQGYMKRGLSLLLLFFVILAVSGFLGLAALAFFLPVVWLYAFSTATISVRRSPPGHSLRMIFCSAFRIWTASGWPSCSAAATA